jgi:hypothetical protein
MSVARCCDVATSLVECIEREEGKPAHSPSIAESCVHHDHMLDAKMRMPQPRDRLAETFGMQTQEEPWGGIAVVWEAGHLMMLFDAGDAWFAWNGKLVHRVLVGLA